MRICTDSSMFLFSAECNLSEAVSVASFLILFNSTTFPFHVKVNAIICTVLDLARGSFTCNPVKAHF